MLTFFSRVKGGGSWIIKGVEHALIFKALFQGCQHGVAERVSLRGEVWLESIFYVLYFAAGIVLSLNSEYASGCKNKILYGSCGS